MRQGVTGIVNKGNQKIKANPIAPRVYLVFVCLLMVSMRLRVCRASASTLPKMHFFNEVVCLANNGACVALMDTEQLGGLPSASGGKHSS